MINRNHAHIFDRRVRKCLALGLALLFLTLAALPVAASHLWGWHSEDACIWGGGCSADGVQIAVGGTIAYTFPERLICPVGRVVFGYTGGGTLSSNISMVLGDRAATVSGGDRMYNVVDFVGIDAASVEFSNGGIASAYLRDVVVLCDSDASTETATVTYGDGGIILGELFIAGLLLLIVWLTLAEKVTER